MNQISSTEFKKKIGRPKGSKNIKTGFDVKVIGNVLELCEKYNVTSFDYCGLKLEFNPKIGHNISNEKNIDESVEYTPEALERAQHREEMLEQLSIENPLEAEKQLILEDNDNWTELD